MKTILKEEKEEIIIQNSRFIAIMIPLQTNDITPFLQRIKEEYPKATHYCYAYRYLDDYKCSDDHEPSNTAGLPMLNVLEKEDFNNVLVVVVRYFGGIKLGAGGLVRAYTKAVTEVLKKITPVLLEEGYTVEISFPYSETKNVDYLLKEQKIIQKEFLEDVIYTIQIPISFLESLEKYSPKIIEKSFYPKG